MERRTCLALGALPAALAVAVSLSTTALRAQDVELRAELVMNFADNADRRPIEATAPPGDTGRLFVASQTGRINIIDLADDSLVPGPFLNIQSKVACCGERGLLGFAFHPDYAENRFFFVYYTRASDGDIVIARYQTREDDPNLADAGSEKILLTIEHSSQSNHNGGKIAFSPIDRYLYIGTGDGGSGCDPADDYNGLPGQDSQNNTSLLGKMLRIDVDSGDPYGIPPDNPFAADDDGVRDEIWALGLRNPWRWAFDSETGDLYIADVGQGTWEEIDFQPASSPGGENYEWKVREGDHNSGCSGIPAYAAGARRAPIYDYNHNGSQASITGGEVYRGSRMPALRGTYFFAEYEVNWVKSLRVVAGAVSGEIVDRTAELNLGIAPDVLDDIAAFGADGSGELYILDHETKVFRIVAAEPSGPPEFLRGNANADAAVDISDAVFILLHLFLGAAPAPACEDSLDTDDTGEINVTDAVFLLDGLFKGGSSPAAPYPGCGVDPTEDTLGCAATACP
jgi:glucose/arabinose dehydrogenase